MACAVLKRRSHLRPAKRLPWGGARESSLTDPKKNGMELHVNWGHASAPQFRRFLVDSEWNNMQLLTRVDEVLAQCEVCQAFEKAPRALVAGTSTAAMINEKLQADSLFRATSSRCVQWMSLPCIPY